MIGPDIPTRSFAQSSSSNREEDSDTEQGPAPIGPQIPSALVTKASTTPPPYPPPDEDEDDDDDYAPALPPELVAARASSSAKRVLGPALPSAATATHYDDDDDDDDDVGPRPLPQGYIIEEKDGVQEFLEREERRRKQLEDASKPQALKREEWMLVPPSSSDLLSSIDPTKMNRPRQFARTAQPSRNTDTSLWTETPAERQQRIADEVAGKRKRATDTTPADESEDARKRRRYEEEVRRGVEDHTKKVRGAALLKQHERTSSTKDADKADEDEPPAFWDHGRDMAVGGRLLDDKTRNKFIQEARGLGDRFGSGKSGGFL